MQRTIGREVWQPRTPAMPTCQNQCELHVYGLCRHPVLLSLLFFPFFSLTSKMHDCIHKIQVQTRQLRDRTYRLFVKKHDFHPLRVYHFGYIILHSLDRVHDKNERFLDIFSINLFFFSFFILAGATLSTQSLRLCLARLTQRFAKFSRRC